MSEMIRVDIETEQEDYPVLSISHQEYDNEYGYDVPASLMDALDSARDVVRRLERAIMEHVAGHYPDASEIHAWMRDHTE